MYDFLLVRHSSSTICELFDGVQ